MFLVCRPIPLNPPKKVFFNFFSAFPPLSLSLCLNWQRQPTRVSESYFVLALNSVEIVSRFSTRSNQFNWSESNSFQRLSGVNLRAFFALIFLKTASEYPTANSFHSKKPFERSLYCWIFCWMSGMSTTVCAVHYARSGSDGTGERGHSAMRALCAKKYFYLSN